MFPNGSPHTDREQLLCSKVERLYQCSTLGSQNELDSENCTEQTKVPQVHSADLAHALRKVAPVVCSCYLCYVDVLYCKIIFFIYDRKKSDYCEA